jgi:hypothetical protein
MLAYFRRYLPASARIEVVEGVGHVPQMERPRDMVRRLTRFAQEAGVLAAAAPSPPRATASAHGGPRPARPSS